MAFLTVTLVTDTDFPDNELVNRIDQSTRGRQQALRAIINHLKGVAGGQYRGIVRTQILSTAGTQTITCDQSAVTVGSTTLVMAGVTFSVVTTASTVTQITLGAGNTAFASNTVTALNAHSTTSTLVLASSSTSIVTLTRLMPDNVGAVTETASGFTVGNAAKGAGGGTVDEYDFGYT